MIYNFQLSTLNFQLKQLQQPPDLRFECDDVAAVQVAVVAVLFADVGAVGDFFCVGFGLEAEMIGAGIGGSDQAGEVEEREERGFVMPEMMPPVGRLECSPLPVPMRVRSAIAHQPEEVMMFRGKQGSPPAAFERTLCKDDPGVHAEQLFRLGGSLPASV